MDNEKEMIVNGLKVYLQHSQEKQTSLKKELKTNWKNSEQSRKLRIKGNGLFAKVANNDLEMENTYKLYSQSIAFAEYDSEELAFAYGNRSAILFCMKKYKECIVDIDAATKIKNSNKFKFKLLCRKLECINLQGLTKNEDIFSEIDSLLSIMKDEDKNKETYKNMFEKSKMSVKVTKGNKLCTSGEKEIPKHVKLLKEKENENTFNSVSIRWSKEYGRYLVAKRDFNAGEIVFIEKPYVKVVNLKNSHMFCGHCLVVSWATIPCNYCNWCMFCSEECKSTAWEQYHSIECTVVSQIIKKRGDISHYEQLTIRALMLGIKDAGSIQNLKNELESVDICTDKSDKGFKSNGSYKAMGLKSMYTLDGAVDLNRLPLYTVNSVFILLSLIKNTSLFDTSLEYNLENLLANEEALFIGSLILKLYKINDKNIQQLPGKNPNRCNYPNDVVTCKSTHCCNSGFCTMTIVSLFNNSCHAQVTNIINNKRSKFIVCSLTPIKKDSQIFLTYCGNWTEMPKKDRQFILRSGFNFTCNCEACKNNWPTLQELIILMQMNPAAYSFMKERYHANATQATVRPFFENYSNAKCTLNTIEILSKAIAAAYKDLKHPSLALARLEWCMKGALEKLYLSDYA